VEVLGGSFMTRVISYISGSLKRSMQHFTEKGEVMRQKQRKERVPRGYTAAQKVEVWDR
jgi:hypothetical protein